MRRGQQIALLDQVTGKIDLIHTPDDLDFAIDDFNRKVITRPFNEVICEELAKHIDPSLPDKTLIFAANDGHADIVVDELKKAFGRRYGDIDDAAVAKITGSVDDPGKLIRRYRNDALPNVAVTVDLLTTGIDIPKIVNLVFIRRVNSRILYEQMMGRATRLCPEIGKETFRIFDAVGIYDALQPLTAMKPVVVNPKLTLTQLLEEFAACYQSRPSCSAARRNHCEDAPEARQTNWRSARRRIKVRQASRCRQRFTVCSMSRWRQWPTGLRASLGLARS